MTHRNHMRAALQSLMAAKPFALPESTLREHVNTRERPPLRAGSGEWTALVSLLLTGGLITFLDTEPGDDERRFVITEAGESWLARR